MTYTNYFKTKTRPNGGDFICLADDAPETLSDLVRSIHTAHFFGCMSNDWVYAKIAEAFDLADSGEDLESSEMAEADIYNHDLTKWLHENCNAYANEYCEQAIEEFGCSKLIEIIGTGQFLAIQNIHHAVARFLQESGGEE